MPTTQLTPPLHLQHLALLSVPSRCLGAPCPHLQAGQGAPPHHLHHPCFPSAPSLHMGQLEAAPVTETGFPAWPSCACFKEGTSLAKAGWAGSPLVPPAPCRAPAQEHPTAGLIDEASGTPQPHRALSAGCCLAKPSTPDPACPVAALPSHATQGWQDWLSWFGWQQQLPCARTNI